MRAFFSIGLSEETKSGLRAFTGGINCGLNWVPGENLHVTLRFLGETDEKLLENIYLAAKQALAGSRCFTMGAGTVGFFPDSGHPKVFWAGVVEGQEKVSQIYSLIEACVAGSVPEPQAGMVYVPHVTLARIKKPSAGKRLVKETREKMGVFFGSTQVDGIEIMKSVFGSGGPQYTAVYRIPLIK